MTYFLPKPVNKLLLSELIAKAFEFMSKEKDNVKWFYSIFFSSSFTILLSNSYKNVNLHFQFNFLYLAKSSA